MGIKVKGILKKEGQTVVKKKRGLVFDATIHYIREFDEDLPVLCVTKPDYICQDDDDDDDSIVYWWEEEDEVIPWYEREDESEMKGYHWDDVNEQRFSGFRTDAMEGLLDAELEGVEYSESTVSSSDEDEDSSSEEYEEETVSDSDDEEYQIGADAQAAPAQWEAATVEAMKAEEPPKQPKVEVVREPTPPPPPAAATPTPPSPGRLDPSDPNFVKPTPNRRTPRRTSRSGSLVKISKEDLDNINAQSQLDNSGRSGTSEATAEAPTEAPAPPAEAPPEEPAPAEEKPTPPPPPPAQVEEKPADEPAPVTVVETKKEETEEKPTKKEEAAGGDKNSDSAKKKKHKRHKSSEKKLRKEMMEQMPVDDGKDPDDPTKYAWEKPDWAKENKLKQTKKGRAVLKGANLAKPITMINRAKNDMMDAKLLSFGKPDWTKKSAILKKTDTGDHLKSGASLAHKITHIAKDPAAQEKFAWEKPEWATKKVVKQTDKGEKLKKGEYLSHGITHIRENDEAKEKYAWKKPEWAQKKVLSKSISGEKMKKGEYLSTGITNNEQAKEKYKWEKPDWTKQVARRSSSATPEELKEAANRAPTNKRSSKSFDLTR